MRSAASASGSALSRSQLNAGGVYKAATGDERTIQLLRKEVAELKAKLEQQASTNQREMAERVEAARKEAELANQEFAAQSRNIHKMREQFQQEKKRLEASIRLQLEDYVRHKRGDMYRNLVESVRGTVLDEQREKEEEVERERASLRNKFALDYQRVVDEAEAKVQQKYAEMSEKFQESPHRQRERWEQQRSEDVEKVQRDWMQTKTHCIQRSS